tara:strand:+ start:22920 stop:23474 length:555 start_codon:yes stop_codon:yes gene_type:complete
MDKNESNIDGNLVLDYLNGNQSAIVKLVARWHKLFCKKAFWMVKDPDVAKDIAQDSWKTIIEKMDTLRNPNSFKSWSFRIVYRKSIDWIHANNKMRDELELYKYEQKEIPEEAVDDLQLKNNLLKAVQALPKKQQHVIKLFYIEDCSLKEIGDILNISIGTAKSRLFHARETLKQTLKYKTYEN